MLTYYARTFYVLFAYYVALHVRCVVITQLAYYNIVNSVQCCILSSVRGGTRGPALWEGLGTRLAHAWL